MASSLFNKVIAGAKNYAGTIGNSISVVLVFSGEFLIKDNLFSCPCYPEQDQEIVYNLQAHTEPNSTRLYYGVSFIIWPAVALFLLASTLSMESQRCLSATTSHCRPRNVYKGTKYYCQNAISTVIPSAAWLLIVFIDGRYYECVVSRLPSNCIPGSADEVPLGNSNLNNTTVSRHLDILTEENDHHIAVSQIIAWTSLGIGVALGTLVTLCSRCFDKKTYYQSIYMEVLRDKELEAFSKVTETMVMKEMEDKWKVFFDKAELGDWEAISDLPTGNPTLRNNKFCYSAFDEWQPKDEREKEEIIENTVNEVNNTNPKAATLEGVGRGRQSSKVGSLEMTD